MMPSRLLRLARRVALSTLAATTAVLLVPLGLPTADAAATFGPVAPYGPDATPLPSWDSDASGLSLTECGDAALVCPAPEADFVSPDGEAFYFLASASLDTTPPPNIPAVASKVVLA